MNLFEEFQSNKMKEYLLKAEEVFFSNYTLNEFYLKLKFKNKSQENIN